MVTKRRKNVGLLVIDAQRDFCEGGSLPVEGGAEICDLIGQHVVDHIWDYEAIALTKDWHVNPVNHFGYPPDWKDTWPEHCKAGFPGSDFHPNLLKHNIGAMGIPVFYKGLFTAAYSGFEGSLSGKDEDSSTLDWYLRFNEVEEVDVCGIATSHCVRSTAIDALEKGYKVNILKDLSVGVTPELHEAALKEMKDLGINLI